MKIGLEVDMVNADFLFLSASSALISVPLLSFLKTAKVV